MERFDNTKYDNWFKDLISLQLAKEGLENFTDNGVTEIHNYIRSSIACTGVCDNCNKADLKKGWRSENFKCIFNICNQWLSEIKKYFNNANSVKFKNVDIPRIPMLPWECAKLFLPQGSQDIQSAKDADIAALMTLFLNCCHFSDQMSDVNICEQVKSIRNRISHLGRPDELKSDELDQDIKTIIQLLEDPKTLAQDPNCKVIVDKIKKLRNSTEELSLYKDLEIKALTEIMKTMNGDVCQLEKEHESLKTKVQQNTSDINDNKTSQQKENHTLQTQLQTQSAIIEKLKSALQSFLGILTSQGLERGHRKTESKHNQLKRTVDDHDEKSSQTYQIVKRQKCEEESEEVGLQTIEAGEGVQTAISQLEEEKKQLKEKLENVEAKLKTNVEEHSKALDDQYKQLQEANNKLHASEGTCSTLQANLDKKKEKLTAAKQKILELEATVTLKTEEYETLKTTHEESTSTFEDVRKQLSDLQNSYKEFEAKHQKTGQLETQTKKAEEREEQLQKKMNPFNY